MRILCFTIVVTYLLVLVSADYGIETSPDCLKCLNGTEDIVQAIEKVISDTGSEKKCGKLCLKVTKKLKHPEIVHLIECEVICEDITLNEINNRTNTHFNYAKICESHKYCPVEDGTGKLVSAAVTNSPVVSGQDIVIEGVLEADTEIGVADLVFECPLNKTTPMTHLLSPMKMDGWKFTWTVPTTDVSEWRVGNYTCDLRQDIVIVGVLEADTEIGVADLVFECPLNKTTPMTHLLSPMKMDGWKFTWTVPTTNVSEWRVGNYTCDLMFCSTICNSYPPPKVFGNATLEFTIAKKKTLTV